MHCTLLRFFPILPCVILATTLAGCKSSPADDVPDAGSDADTEQDQPDTSPSLLDRCTESSASNCLLFDLDACASHENITSCVEDAGDDCTVARSCFVTLADDGVAFSTGPYGTGVKDIAGPFSLETTDGIFDFQRQWTGIDSHVFLAHTSRSTSLFGSSIKALLDASPPNVHYFFGWKGNKPDGFDDTEIAWKEHIATRDDADTWLTRVHFLTTNFETAPGWIGEMMAYRWSSKFDPGSQYYRNVNGPVGFAIDRFQRIRELGMLGTVQSDSRPYLANHPKGYDFEADLQRRLDSEKNVTTVVLADRQTVHDTADFDVVIPDLSGFDTLEVDLALDCPGHLPGNCGAWDYLSHMWVCDSPTSEPGGDVEWNCDRELARWITSYWTETRHVTDISQQLAALKPGPQHIRFFANGQFDDGHGDGVGSHYRPTDYIVSLSLRFSARQKGEKPVALIPLWTGGDWNEGYNATKLPIGVEVPSDTKRVELAVLVTGHGGVAVTNCAEFCNHQHHFTVNGTPYLQEFPEAQASQGCTKRVDEGVTPNQFGTWYYGRGGWCPGTDVPPALFDVTDSVTKGASNTFEYHTTFRGDPLKARTDGGVNNQGNIVLSSWVVLWK